MRCDHGRVCARRSWWVSFGMNLMPMSGGILWVLLVGGKVYKIILKHEANYGVSGDAGLYGNHVYILPRRFTDEDAGALDGVVRHVVSLVALDDGADDVVDGGVHEDAVDRLADRTDGVFLDGVVQRR